MLIDPVAAERIKPNDNQRIQRALEVFMLNESPFPHGKPTIHIP